MRRITDPQGRLDDVFSYPGDVIVHPHVFRSVLGRHPQIIEYQIRQTSNGADIGVVADDGIDLAAIDRELQIGLRNVGLANPEIVTATVTSLERQPSGKLKRFLPLKERAI